MPLVVEKPSVVEEPLVVEEPSVKELFSFDCFDHHHYHSPSLVSQLMDFTPVTDYHVVDCTGVSSYLPDDPINCPTLAAYNTALDSRIRKFINDNPSGISDCVPVIFDMGASLAITPSWHDFIGPITPIPGLHLGGMANGMLIGGKGMIEWSFRTQAATVIIKSECYLVPDCLVQLISPQRLFKAARITGEFITREEECILKFANAPSLTVNYDSKNHLRTATPRNATGSNPVMNWCVTADKNQNVTPAAKRLLQWHFCFGHRNIFDIHQILWSSPFGSDKYLSAERIPFEQRPRCEVCQYAKAKRRHLEGKGQVIDPNKEGVLKDTHLWPGAGVSVDHFESQIKCHTLSSFGRANSDQYVGGCIFVDHMSSYINIEHQLGFSGSETICAKQNYEKLCLDYGIMVDTYLADNGVFKANKFVQHIHDHNQ